MSKTADYLMSLEKACCNCAHYRKDDIATQLAQSVRMICDRDIMETTPSDTCVHFAKAGCPGGCRCFDCEEEKKKMDSDIAADAMFGTELLLVFALLGGCCFGSEFEDFCVTFAKENNVEIVNKGNPKVIWCDDVADLQAKSGTDESRFCIKVQEPNSEIYILKNDNPQMFYCVMWMYRFTPPNFDDHPEKWRTLLMLFRTQWNAREKKSPEEGGEQ